MSGPEDVPIDEVALVYGWMLRLCGGDQRLAVDWTVEAIGRHRRGESPSWLHRRTVLVRLQYATAMVALEHKRWPGRQEGQTPEVTE